SRGPAHALERNPDHRRRIRGHPRRRFLAVHAARIHRLRRPVRPGGGSRRAGRRRRHRLRRAQAGPLRAGERRPPLLRSGDGGGEAERRPGAGGPGGQGERAVPGRGDRAHAAADGTRPVRSRLRRQRTDGLEGLAQRGSRPARRDGGPRRMILRRAAASLALLALAGCAHSTGAGTWPVEAPERVEAAPAGQAPKVSAVAYQHYVDALLAKNAEDYNTAATELREALLYDPGSPHLHAVL